MTRKVAFCTLGCKVNQADSAAMEHLFQQAGYEIVPFTEPAEICVINTCVVTNTGQHKSRQMINRAVRNNSKSFVVVTGCYPQTAAAEVKALPGVDLIIGTQDRRNIVKLVEEGLAQKQGGDAVHQFTPQTVFEELPGGNEENKTRAYLKIQEGCNQFCTYCIIPYARGPLRSRSLSSIRREVEQLVAAGYKEIVLIGIHLGCYGQEAQALPAPALAKSVCGAAEDGTVTAGAGSLAPGRRVTLYDAVQAALSVPGLDRLRLGSLESVEVEERLLDLMQKDARFCPHLHLPLQSGCDKILSAMHRPYDTARFKQLLAQIRRKVPGIAITTDVIVGFPGETEEDFLATCALVQECQFAKMHIFPYSVRQGTPAASYPAKVTEAVKEERARRLAVLDRQMHQDYLQQQVGRTLQVLVEQPAPEGQVEGLTGNYQRVFFQGPDSWAGKIILVQITGVQGDKLQGIPLI
jgi:threonylcarbamoyladenosine tRNA methylthiotransferase MtaB